MQAHPNVQLQPSRKVQQGAHCDPVLKTKLLLFHLLPAVSAPAFRFEGYACHMSRVGQNHIYTVYIRYFWQGNHQIYGHIRCIYTVLANPTHVTVFLMSDFKVHVENVIAIVDTLWDQLCVICSCKLAPVSAPAF